MHGYSTDSSERRIVPLLLALLAIALAWTSSKFLASAHLSVPWAYLGVVAALAVAGLAIAGATAIRAARRPPLTVLRDL